nr:hypothetical protein [Brachyspira hyodysenteriae]MDA0073494.1 hypothetical protein [Brachyspira hyodysenteriae]
MKDTLLDIAGYCVLALIYIKRKYLIRLIMYLVEELDCKILETSEDIGNLIFKLDKILKYPR